MLLMTGFYVVEVYFEKKGSLNGRSCNLSLSSDAFYSERLRLMLDFDHHWLAACIAPRHLYVAESTGDMPRYGDWYSLVLASSAWDLYGVEALKFGPMPRPEKPVCTIGMGFHVRNGPHSVYASDWTRILDYADLCMLQGR